MILLIFLYALSALKLVLSKQALSYAPPIFLVAAHNGIAGFLLIVYHAFGAHSFQINKHHIIVFLKAIIFGIYIPYILRFWGLQYIPAYKTSLLLSLTPFVSYIMSYVFDQETWAWTKFSGLCIGFLGMLPILILQTPSEALLKNFLFLSTAELATLVSTVSLIYGWISMKQLAKTELYDSTFLNGITMACGGLLALITSYLKESIVIAQQDLTALIAILAFIIFIGNIFVHTMYVHLLKKFNITILAFAKLLTPIFTAFYSWLFWGNTITWHFYIGFIFLIFGFALFYQEEIKKIYGDNQFNNILYYLITDKIKS